MIFPDATGLLAFMLDDLTRVIGGLVVFPDRMRENLDAHGGIAYSQSVLLALVDAGLARDDAYRIVQRSGRRGVGRRRRASATPSPPTPRCVQRSTAPPSRSCSTPPGSCATSGRCSSGSRSSRVEAPGRDGTTGQLLAQRQGPRRLRRGRRDPAARRHRSHQRIRRRAARADPDKGRVLTGLSLHWFERTADLIGNHVVSADRGVVPRPVRRRAEPGGPGAARAPRRRRAARVRRARLPERQRLGPVPTRPARSAVSACPPGWSSPTACPSRSSRRPRRPRRATTSR